MMGSKNIRNTGKQRFRPYRGSGGVYRTAAQADGNIVSAENALKKFFLNSVFVRQAPARHPSLLPRM
jgi:hypothetical protein